MFKKSADNKENSEEYKTHFRNIFNEYLENLTIEQMILMENER